MKHTDKRVTTASALRSLCIKENWFTAGTCEQYGKLFYANENGWPIEEIATIIWLCSDDVARRDILKELKFAQEKYRKLIAGDEIYC